MVSRWCRMVSTASGAEIEAKFPGQFLENGWTKTNARSTVCSTARDTHHIKKWTQSVHSSRSYSKKKVPYQMTMEERYTTSRAKIEHLNHRKWYIKYTYSESAWNGLFKTLIFQNTVQNFKVTKRCQPLVSTSSGAKTRASLLANFSKTAEQK